MIFRFKLLFLVSSIIFLFAFNLTANIEGNKQTGETHHDTGITQHDKENSHPGTEATHHPEETKFDPGTFIFDHIGDAHNWHLMTIKGKHISVPLPVIVISKYSGLHVFMSSHFHHGHSSYEGLELPAEGEYKGKIIEKPENGEIYQPVDLSITKNVLAIFISLIILAWIIFAVARAYKQNPGVAPKGIQNLLEPVIIFIRDEVAMPSIGEKKYERFMPFLLTLFLFILINNLMGLIPILPGGANVTGNISVTMVLALFTFFITVINGNRNYWKHIFNGPGIPWWLKLPLPLIPIIELVGIFIKPFVLMIRLFANISAGHIIALGFFSLIFIFGGIQAGIGYGVSVISIAFTVFMTCLELLVAFIQAYVFTLLSAIYFGMAVEEHH